MLRRFAVENFKNFKNRTEIDFTAVRNYSFNPQYVRGDILNKVILLGKNGTGKTNLGLAIFDIVMTLTDNTVGAIQADPGSYLNGDSRKKYAQFEYEFQQDARRIRYTYRKTDPHTIVFEELYVEDRLIFRRNGNMTEYDGLAEWSADNLRMNVSNGPLSVLRYVNANTIQPEGSPIAFVMNFASHMLYFKSDIQGNAFIGYGKGELIYDYIINNGLTEDFQKMLSEFAEIDAELGVAKIPGTPGVFVQKFKNKQLRFDMISSTGTAVFALFYYWYKHLNDIKFLYMDEFDAYYHYEMSERVVHLVSGMEGFQTVFTTHNISLLRNELLRPDCCLVLENGRIRSFSDSTERELRQGHNLEKMYRNGEFDEQEYPVRGGRREDGTQVPQASYQSDAHLRKI